MSSEDACANAQADPNLRWAHMFRSRLSDIAAIIRTGPVLTFYEINRF